MAFCLFCAALRAWHSSAAALQHMQMTLLLLSRQASVCSLTPKTWFQHVQGHLHALPMSQLPAMPALQTCVP